VAPAKLAHLNKVRANGYCVSLSERESESAAIACPVFRTGQELVCAISLGIPRFRFDRKAFDTYLPMVMEASATLTKTLGGDTTLFEPPYAAFDGV
jgi:DNA-binding IclR family transcriptional regulator